jgi:hypothetical protein
VPRCHMVICLSLALHHDIVGAVVAITFFISRSLQVERRSQTAARGILKIPYVSPLCRCRMLILYQVVGTMSSPIILSLRCNRVRLQVQCSFHHHRRSKLRRNSR